MALFRRNGKRKRTEVKDTWKFTLTRQDDSTRWFTDQFPVGDEGHSEVMSFCEQMLVENPDVKDIHIENLSAIPYDEELD